MYLKLVQRNMCFLNDGPDLAQAQPFDRRSDSACVRRFLRRLGRRPRRQLHRHSWVEAVTLNVHILRRAVLLQFLHKARRGLDVFVQRAVEYIVRAEILF